MNLRTRRPEGLDEQEWKSRGGDDIHLPPKEPPDWVEPLETLCGVVGSETDPVDADATCPACLALAQGQERKQPNRAHERDKTPENSDREIDEPAALRTSPGSGQRDRRPRVEVTIGRPAETKTRATAMIATGSDASFIRTSVAESLGLRVRPDRKWRIRTDGDAKQIDVAEAGLGLTDGTAITEWIELGCLDELPPGCDLVIGRDGLATLTFRYNGSTGEATLEAS